MLQKLSIMFSSLSVIVTVTLYMGLLFATAQWVEKKVQARNQAGKGNRWMFALSLAIYHTSWTFYGSVGFASTYGMLYTGIYIGAIMGIALWWSTARRMIFAKETFRITSIADFISTRYNRSQNIAALVTLIALIGILPYIALQLKAIISSFELITNTGRSDQEHDLASVVVTLFMIAFTIIFGVRKLDPTERHQGMMAALVVECIIKLLAFLIIGVFVTFYLFDGFTDLAQLSQEANLQHIFSFNAHENSPSMWMTLIILSFAAIYTLPRQFHVTVVENSNHQHLKTAMWVFPLYIIAINIFVVPIAAAGLLMGLSPDNADFFVLLLPQQAGSEALTMLAFIGGFSAATGMIIITTMTLSTMASNHILLPILEKVPALRSVRSYLLQLRWALVALILMSSLWFAREFADSYILVSIGLLSFVAVLQFAPALLGGLFWSKGNSLGALLGLLSGFFIWCYSLLIPAFIKQSWFSDALLLDGPWQSALLRPEALFGLDGFHPVTHALIWSLLFNIGFYIIGSLLFSPNKNERTLTTEFLYSLTSNRSRRARPTGLDAYIPLQERLEEARTLLSEYLTPDKADAEIDTIAEDLQVKNKSNVTIIELVEFHRMIEHVLAGSIGAASAHQAIENTIHYTAREEADLKALYSHIVTELKVTDKEADKLEAENGNSGFGFIEDLQAQIDELEETVKTQKAAISTLEDKLDQRYEEIFKYRMETQKIQNNNQLLQEELNQLLTKQRGND